MHSAARRFPSLATLIIFTASAALAQTSTSRIVGRVADSKQDSVAGATVTVTNEATGVAQTQTTTDAGVFAFDSLPVGDYTVMVEQTGFKKFVKTGNHLEVNTPLDVDAQMDVGSLSETV